MTIARRKEYPHFSHIRDFQKIKHIYRVGKRQQIAEDYSYFQVNRPRRGDTAMLTGVNLSLNPYPTGILLTLNPLLLLKLRCTHKSSNYPKQKKNLTLSSP